MEKRKEINDKIVDWIINKVKKEYAMDISLVLIYGSYVNGTANAKSDVDCYFIPKTERGYHLAVDFIIADVGYDIFPISWERVERIADLDESLSPLVGDVQIIYCSDSKDLEHFKNLQDKLKKNLSDKEYIQNIAEKRCQTAADLCAWMKSSKNACEIRKIAGYMIMTLADAVAVYNHDYYHFGLKKQYEDLCDNFKGVPQNIVTGYRNVITAEHTDEVVKYAAIMLNDVCDYLNILPVIQESVPNETMTAKDINASWLARLYEEISSTFQKIYVCCENDNYMLAFLSAVCLQWDLDDAKEAGCPEYDLLSDFNYNKLNILSEQTHIIEDDLVCLITDNGGRIKKYDNFEEFEAAQL